jgi:DNA-binding IclR family transcriptional regulator
MQGAAYLRVTDLGMSALNETGLREHAHPYLVELCQRTSYPASLGVLDGTDVVYLDHVRSHHRTHDRDLDLPVGSRAPAYCTAIGKLLLAHLPEPEQRDLITQLRLIKHGPNTVTSKKALRAELAVIVLAGFAVEDEEFAAKRYAVAVPIRNANRVVVAGVSLAIPSSLITLGELVDALGPHLITTAGQISARGRFRRNDQQST